MRKAGAFKKLRVRPMGIWTSLAVLTALLAAFFFHCTCSPLCGTEPAAGSKDRPVVAEQTGCCTSYHPAEKPTPKSCCPKESGASCFITQLSESILPQTLSGSAQHMPEPVAERFERRDPPAAVCQTNLRSSQLADSINSPPPWLRFEILRI